MLHSPNFWVLVPAFNEQTTVGMVIDQLKDSNYQVLVIDDCSTDRTAHLAVDHGAQVITHPINLGQGAALETGRQYLLDQGAEYICTFDADGQHDANDIEKMFTTLQNQNADLVIGSRFIGHAEALPASRRAVLKLAILFHRVIYGIDFTDTHNGLRIFSRSAAEKISIDSPRMAHATEILSKAHAMELAIVECPVTISYSKYSLGKGQNIFSSLTIIKDLILKELFK